MKDVMLETRDLVEGKRELSPKEMQAMKLLLRGDLSMAQVASRMKIGPVTLWRITSDDFFKQELRSYQETIFNASLSALIGQANDMARELVSIAMDKSNAPGVRVAAIKLAFRATLDLGSQFEFRNRLSKIEQQLNDM